MNIGHPLTLTLTLTNLSWYHLYPVNRELKAGQKHQYVTQKDKISICKETAVTESFKNYFLSFTPTVELLI